MSGSGNGAAPAWRVALDVGGTFTDVVATDDAGRVACFKLLSSPPAFDKAAIDGVVAVLADLGLPATALHTVLHGTTAATNAVLERSGPPTALITTSGFGDVLEIGRLRTPRIYDLSWEKPPPLVPRDLRIEAVERVTASGEVLTALDIDSFDGEVRSAVAAGTHAFAISLLNSWANDVHESAIARWLRTELPNVTVTVGSQLSREPGEYERTSTAVLNAYLQPVISDYLSRLRGGLADHGITAPVFVLQSSGGMMAPDEAARFPVHLLESGPAAGVLAAAAVARRAAAPSAIGFDMGGTTAKASLIEDGQPSFAPEFSVGGDVSAASRLLRGGGYAVRLPVIDLAEVGAGGGSIATIDTAGGLSVGPRSAGADPGPACYGRGGKWATVTDANLVLGYLSVEGLARSGVAARPDLAAAAIRTTIADPLGLTVFEGAYAIHSVANERMAQVLRAVTTERGRSIEKQTLIVSGGSGAVHAAGLADTVGITTVIVPPFSGLLSAVGLLGAKPQLTTVETVNQALDAVSAAGLDAQLNRMARDLRVRMSAAGLNVTNAEYERVVDLHYAGQATELPITVPSTHLDTDDLRQLAETFGHEHEETYGHGGHGLIEVVRARVTVSLPAPPIPVARPSCNGTAARPEPRRPGAAPEGRRGSRHAVFGRAIATQVVARCDLGTGHPGPVLVDEPDTTVVVPPRWRASTDEAGNIVLERTG